MNHEKEVGGIWLGEGGPSGSSDRLRSSAVGDRRGVAGSVFCRCFIHEVLSCLPCTDGLRRNEQCRHGTVTAQCPQHAVHDLVRRRHLRELALAVRHIRRVIAKRDLLKQLGPRWRGCCSGDWGRSERQRTLRDKLAFHVDASVIRAGLKGLASDGEPVVVRSEMVARPTRSISAFDSKRRSGAGTRTVGGRTDHQDRGLNIRLISGALQQVFQEVLALSGLKRGAARPMNGTDAQ